MARPTRPAHGAPGWDSYLEAVFDDLYTKVGGGVYVGPSAPVTDPGSEYVWVQTGLGSGGTEMTVWVEDGT